MSNQKGKRSWSEQEDAFVRANHGHLAPELMARALNRTVRAVGVRASRLGVRSQRIGYTASDLSHELGMDVTKVTRLLADGTIKGEKRFSYEGREPAWWQVDEGAVIAFLEGHFLLYNPETVGESWQKHIPVDKRAQWIPLNQAVVEFNYGLQWFYELIWRGLIKAQKGWSLEGPWRLYLYLPDIHYFLENRKTMQPFARRVKTNSPHYKKGRQRGYQVAP